MTTFQQNVGITFRIKHKMYFEKEMTDMADINALCCLTVHQVQIVTWGN